MVLIYRSDPLKEYIGVTRKQIRFTNFSHHPRPTFKNQQARQGSMRILTFLIWEIISCAH